MPFKKGDENINKKGRGSGTPNKVTNNMREFIASILEDDRERFKQLLAKLEGKDYVKAYLELIQYTTPKLRMSEIKETTTLEEFIQMAPDERKALLEKLKKQINE